jgi:hypothetical protein
MSEETTADAAEGGSFPACQISLVNPAGAMLVLRSGDVEGLVAQLNEIWDGHVGKRTDVTNLYLFSFNPAIVADMREGRTAEEALGYEPDELATAAYNALAQGARRQPVSAPAANGARSGGGGSSAAKFRVGDDGYGEGDLPSFFLDKLTRRNTCPECDEDEFWDNRESKQNDRSPDFKCANRDCPGGKGRGWAVWPDDEKPRSRSGSRTR